MEMIDARWCMHEDRTEGRWVMANHETRGSARVTAAGGKARHRWSREVADIEFHVDDFGAKATVVWRKRNEMVIRSGAVLRRDIPLNKNGSIGFDGRFGTQIRAEHEDAIDDFTTTADVVLRSVNEVGLFLYYGRTNGWLVLRDGDGRTIHDWTVVPER
jgi:hypothetical protein